MATNGDGRGERRIWILGPLVVAIVAWIAIELVDLDGSPQSWLLLRLFHSGPKYFDMTVDLVVDGRPVRLVRTIECKPKFAHSDMSSNFGYSIRWYPSRYLISEKLEDGSGIMVVVPRACSLEVPPSPDFAPLVLWTESAVNPRVIEVYVDQRGLLDGAFRTQLKHFDVSLNVASRPADYPNDFADQLNIFSEDPSPVGKLLQFAGVAAFELSTSDLPEAAAAVSTTTSEQGFMAIPKPTEVVDRDSSRAISYVIGTRSGAYYSDPPASMVQERDLLKAKTASLVAFLPDDQGTFKLQKSPRGIVYLVPLNLSWCAAGGIRCITDDTSEVTTINDRLEHYFVRQRKLYVIFEVYFTLISRHP